jgi:hypothetical protein
MAGAPDVTCRSFEFRERILSLLRPPTIITLAVAGTTLPFTNDFCGPDQLSQAYCVL